MIRPEFYGAYHEIVHATKAHNPASCTLDPEIDGVQSQNQGSSAATNSRASCPGADATAEHNPNPSPVSGPLDQQNGPELGSSPLECVTVVGNVCESGDVVGRERWLPRVEVGDALLVRDTGAYGYSMASNYNLMCRPAEVLVTAEGRVRLIRRAETLEDLVRTCIDPEIEAGGSANPEASNDLE